MEYKYSPFDKSNESIESTKVDGALLQQRCFSKSTNDMQQSNGKLDFSNRIKVFSI